MALGTDSRHDPLRGELSGSEVTECTAVTSGALAAPGGAHESDDVDTAGDPSASVRRAKALSDPTRARIHEILTRADGPAVAADLAAAVGVHHTAVRQHLTILADAGLVTSQRLDPVGRGRPRLGWWAVPDAPSPYQTLATMLAEAVRSGRTAREQGQVVGARLTTPSEPRTNRTRDGVESIVAEAERLGFEPTVERRRAGRVDVVLHTCPFADVAALDPATVCDLHHGLAEGIAEGCGGLAVEALDVRPAHVAGCRLRLRVT